MSNFNVRVQNTFSSYAIELSGSVFVHRFEEFNSFFFALRCCYRIFVLNLTYWFLCQFGFLQLVVFECSAVNSKNTLFFSKINFVSIFNFFVCFNMQSKLHLCNVIRTHSPCLAFNVLYFKPNVTLIDRTRKINFRNVSRLLNVRE